MDYQESTGKELAWKSGFLSLGDRLRSLEEQRNRLQVSSSSSSSQRQSPQRRSPIRQTQFATLNELFQSKQSNFQHQIFNTNEDDDFNQKRQRYETNSRLLQPLPDAEQPRKPKIPIMKLSKEDWNVKCWEDRLRRRQTTTTTTTDGEMTGTGTQSRENVASHRQLRSDGSWLRRPAPLGARRVEVFQGRIEDVASKLEKVREGAPQDTRLYELSLNKPGSGAGGQVSRSHEWTDLLKGELESQAHSPRSLRSSTGGSQSHLRYSHSTRSIRPLRKIFQDDEEEDKLS